ncbi:glycosyltransferase [Bacillus thuringiensis]|uniref:glycosyltransferase n=1 Tax=Bacillus thuringiensis TaxID=1428 RepID=UPI001145C423|nr:glycosyltransferase [Bacillus thuringiensis]
MKRGNRVRKNNISLCVIIKNEEESIERCLNSIKELIDEIIIDTGSSDHTIDICK